MPRTMAKKQATTDLVSSCPFLCLCLSTFEAAFHARPLSLFLSLRETPQPEVWMSSSYCLAPFPGCKDSFPLPLLCPFQNHGPCLCAWHEAFLRKNLISRGPRNGSFSEFELFVSLFHGSLRKCHETSYHSETCSLQCLPCLEKNLWLLLFSPICFLLQ